MEPSQKGGRGGGWRRGRGAKNETVSSAEHRGRGRGSHRENRAHHRGSRGRDLPLGNQRRHSPCVKTWKHPSNGHEEANREDLEEEEPGIFSRRKLESNWDRYKASEKDFQNEEGPTQRGSDYHVLLSSAGDSFTQFRFSEEKEWEVDSVASHLVSAEFVDLQALARALQELPLHLRLNLESELVQSVTPVELPSMALKNNLDSDLVRQFRPAACAKPGHTGGLDVSCVVSPVSGTALASNAFHISPNTAQPPADHLHKELDQLLVLQTPVTSSLSQSQTVCVPEEEKIVPEACISQDTPTEEDLEDWLDSMIS